MADGNRTLRVNTDILTQRASDAERKISNMESRLNEIKSLIDRTSGYWIGEAGDKCRKDYQEQQDSVNKILKEMKTEPQKLLEIAGVYVSKEKDAAGKSGPLPGVL